MSERFIPAEESAAFERWQGVSFDPPKARQRGAVALPTAQELEAMQQRAQAEGYAAGLAEARAAAQRLAATSEAFCAAIASIETDVAQTLLTLALDLAQQIVRTSLQVRPELVLPVVRETLRGMSGSYQNNVLLLNPADAELVSRHLAEELAKNGWRVIADERVAAGGCRVESSNSDVDATLQERWKLALATLGRDDAWLA